MTGSLTADLDEVLDLTTSLWRELGGARILVTGGTGFMGCWMLETLARARNQFHLDLQVVVLTRDSEAFTRKAPHLAGSGVIQLVQGDVRRLPPLPGTFSHLIHAATDASTALLAADPGGMFDTILSGTRAVLEAADSKGIARGLFLSSGAVYGRQSPEVERVPEDWNGILDCADPGSAYAEGKRAAETLCAIHARQHGLPITIARCFAFVGPYLPLDAHFAIGNFIGDALRGEPIQVKGDGTAIRSYLYGTDLAAWLWHLLLRGKAGVPYNVGSEEAVSIAELAAAVGEELGCPYQILGRPNPDSAPERYLPATERARLQLGLRETVPLREAIRRTARWHAG